MIDLKMEDDAQDLGAWKWLLDLLDHLGEDGMSSEESDIDARTGMEFYYVKEMTWRRDVQYEMTVIDNERHKEKQLFTKKGAKPMSRIRNGAKGGTRRSAPKGLSKTLYFKDWLAELSAAGQRSLEISDDKFKWMVIH
jgi:hypothetical protein